jgi:hypothetical protein
MKINRTRKNEGTSGKMKRLLNLLLILSIAGCALMLFAQTRFFVISCVEKFIVHRNLNHQMWDNVLFIYSLSGIFLFISLFIISRSFVTQFLAENYAAARYLLILPAFLGFLVVTVFGVNIPHWDEWELVAFLDGVLEHGIQFKEFFAPHNEHRIFFPRIVFLVSALLSHFNVKLNMYLSWTLMSAMYTCYLVYLKDMIVCETSSDKLKRLFFGLMIGFCCFNIVQHENITWGFQTAFMMVASFSVCCFYYFYRWYTEKKFCYILISMTAGFIASFSSIHGLFVFPVIVGVLFLLLLSGEKIHSKYIFLVIWTVLIFIIYFYDYSAPSGHGKYFMKSLPETALSFFAGIGSPFFLSRLIVPAIVFGIFLFFFGLSFTIYLIMKRRTAKHIFPLCLIYFGYAFCGAIAVGRSGMGIEAVLPSRYTTFSLFAIIGLAIIVYTEFNTGGELKKLKRLAVRIVNLFLILSLLQYLFIGQLAENAHNAKIRQTFLLDYKNQTLDTLKSSYPWTDIDSAYNQIRILEKNRWSIFSRFEAEASD